MLIRTVTTPGIALNSYLIADSLTQQAIIIDPSRHVKPLLEMVVKEDLQVRYILETHVHADCISGSVELQSRLKEKPPIVCSSLGGDKLLPSYATLQAKEGEVISAGSMRFEALHTPGHTPEHLIWLLYDLERSGILPFAAFTGDLLFVGSVGRPDLLGKEQLPEALKDLHHSLFSTLEPLPDSLLIYPAHGMGSLCGKHLLETGVTTLGYERKLNPYLQKETIEVWNAQLLEALPKAPALFTSIKRQNCKKPLLIQELAQPKMVSCEELLKLSANSDAQCLDTRPAALFAFGHLPGFISIALRLQFTYWVAQWIDPSKPLYIISSDKEELAQVLEQLAWIGLEKVEAAAFMDRTTSERMAASLVNTPSLNPIWAEHLRQQQGGHFCLLDVRFAHEREIAKIPGSIGIPLQELESRLQELPQGIPIAITCRTGPRATMAASLLQKLGLKEVSILLGGIEGWKKAGLPLEGMKPPVNEAIKGKV